MMIRTNIIKWTDKEQKFGEVKQLAQGYTPGKRDSRIFTYV